MTEVATPTVDSIIGTYVRVRAEKHAKDAAHKAEMKRYDDKLKKLEAWLHIKMTVDGVNSFNTDAGTAYTTTTSQATVTDMNSLLEFIKKNEAWHLLDKRVSKVGVRELIDAGQPVPPGVDWYTSTSINIRKPSER